MRPRTKIEPLPDPNLSEFENFDRFMRILVTKPPQPKTALKTTKNQGRSRRLPRP